VTKPIINLTNDVVNYLDPALPAHRRLIIEAMARKGGPVGTLQERVHRLFLSNRPGTAGSLDEMLNENLRAGRLVRGW
jgi:hypothetical protein